MIELLLIAVLSGYAGWNLKPDADLVPCPVSPLVQAICVAPTPPADDTFGATTEALADAVFKYRLCRVAAGVKTQE